MRLLKTVLAAVGSLLIASAASANVFSFQQVTAFDLNALIPGDVVILDIMYVQDTDLTSLGFGVLSSQAGVGALTDGAQNAGGWFFPPGGPFVSPSGTIQVSPDDVRQFAWFNLTPWPANGINTTSTTAGEPPGRLGFIEITALAPGTTTIETYIGPDDGVNDGNFNPVNPTLASIQLTVVPEPSTALLVGLGLVGLGVAGRRTP